MRMENPARRGLVWIASAALALTAVLLSGCGSRTTPVEDGLRDQVLHIGNLVEPADLDPQTVTSQQDFNIMLSLFEGLMNYDPETARPVLGVADHWERSDDGLVYTFHIREDARWSNGDPVTAQDFLFSFKRILSPGLASEYAYMHFYVKGAQAFYKGEFKDFAQTGYKAIDEHTLQVTLDRPTPYFLGLLAHASWFPVHPATVLAHGAIDDRGTSWTRPENIVGNGPFVLHEWSPNQVIEVRKSKTYWGAKDVRLNAIRFYPIESADTEERAFRSGQLHVSSTIPISKIDVYKREHPELLHLNPLLATYVYRFNVTRKPLDDVRVRRALALAIDREAIVTKVTRAGQQPARSFTPPGTAGYPTKAQLKGGPDEARTLLAEAGFPEGKGFPRLELVYNTNEGHRQIAEAIQAMWRSTLGIEIVLHNQEAKVQSDTMRNLNYDIARFAWIGDYNDPTTFLDIMRSDSGNNQTGWSNAEYDRLLDEASRTLDESARYALLERAEGILMQEVPIAPIYFYTRANLRLPMVKGWYANPLDLHPYQGVYLEE